jgi:hypothetical protein
MFQSKRSSTGFIRGSLRFSLSGRGELHLGSRDKSLGIRISGQKIRKGGNWPKKTWLIIKSIKGFP